MAGSAEKFSVVDGVFPTVTPGFAVMQVEIHPTATALTLRSSFCLDLRFDVAPSLIILGVAEPDVLR
jgi:hypothetical protein